MFWNCWKVDSRLEVSLLKNAAVILCLRSFCASLFTKICAIVGPGSSWSPPAASRASRRLLLSVLPESRRAALSLVELPALEVLPLRTKERDVSDSSSAPPWFLPLSSAASALRLSSCMAYCVYLIELRNLLKKSIPFNEMVFLCSYINKIINSSN